MEGSVSIHHGPYESIPDTASPGLRFLGRFLPAIDNLDTTQDLVSSFFKAEAPIAIDNNPPNPAYSAIPLLEVRSRHLSYFKHQVHIAWDMDLSASANSSTARENSSDLQIAGQIPESQTQDSSQKSVKRTVMFEASTETIFKDDPDNFPIKIREFNIIDLEGSSEEDVQVTEMRIYLDARPLQARAALLKTELAFGESQRETQIE